MNCFELEIFTSAKAEVYLSGGNWSPAAAQLVKKLDESYIRVVGDVIGRSYDEKRIRRIMSGCDGLVSLSAAPSDSLLLQDLRIGAELGLPLTSVTEDGISPEVIQLSGGRKPGHPVKPYAFFIGRLERDFTQAREAIKAAVENEAGIPFLWADDGCHRTNVAGVREATRVLIEHAAFVVADLTLGVENPNGENPSRAHEIGMSIAYNRKLLLLSQEPRRYPYFSIGDLQMEFWSTEADLERKVKRWICNYRDCIARTTWNYRLPEAGYKPKLPMVEFRFNPEERYIGPKTPKSNYAELRILPRKQ